MRPSSSFVLIGLLHRFLGQVKIVGIGRRLVVVVDKAHGDYPGRKEMFVPEKSGCKKQQRDQDLQQRMLCVSLFFHQKTSPDFFLIRIRYEIRAYYSCICLFAVILFPDT